MLKSAIIGGSGYTGGEVARLLCRHPEISLVAMTSRQNAGVRISKVLPFLTGFLDLTFTEKLTGASDLDVVFTATPNGASMEVVPELLECGTKVVDLSGDYRLKDPAQYTKWYSIVHKDTKNLEGAVYGMAEVNRDMIAKADLVANPGCYPTCSVLSLAPLFANDMIEGRAYIDAKSGTSGAGQELTKATHHPACGATITPYKIGNHRHNPEIKAMVDLISGSDVEVVFTPHLLPIVRGMLTTSYVRLKKETSNEEISAAYADYYSGRKFVRTASIPSIPSVVGSNYCEVGFEIVDERNLVVMGALDNLVKGGAGQAVQNANIIFGLDEACGLDFPGLGV